MIRPTLTLGFWAATLGSLALPLACGESECTGPGGLCISPPGASGGKAGRTGEGGESAEGGDAAGRGGKGGTSPGSGGTNGGRGGTGGSEGGDSGEGALGGTGGRGGTGATDDGGDGGEQNGVSGAGGSVGGAGGSSVGMGGSLGGIAGSIGVGGSATGGMSSAGGPSPTGGVGGSGTGAVGGFAAAAGKGGAGAGTCPAEPDFSPAICDEGAAGEGGAPSQSGCGTGSSGAGGSGFAVFPIDDLEDGDVGTFSVLGASGGWFAVNSGEGQQFPSPCAMSSDASNLGNRPSNYAMHTYGLGFFSHSWAQVGISLKTGEDCSGAVDVRGVTGVRFWLRGSSGGVQTIRFMVATVDTNEPSAGGTCVTDCWRYYTTTMSVGAEWNQYYVPFDSLVQSGYPIPLNKTGLLNLVWEAGTGFSGVSSCFDFWIDDVAFYRE
jgi:hypothetical protein